VDTRRDGTTRFGDHKDTIGISRAGGTANQGIPGAVCRAADGKAIEVDRQLDFGHPIVGAFPSGDPVCEDRHNQIAGQYVTTGIEDLHGKAGVISGKTSIAGSAGLANFQYTVGSEDVMGQTKCSSGKQYGRESIDFHGNFPSGDGPNILQASRDVEGARE
jgi:hypothetical protein